MSLPISAIQRRVAAHFGIELTELLSRRIGRGVARPRQVAMYLARELTGHSLPEIGREFDRDHTTVLHGIIMVERECRRNPDFAFLVAGLWTDFIRAADGLAAHTSVDVGDDGPGPVDGP